MKIFLARHGESTWQDGDDKSHECNLTAKGRRQAKLLGKHLKKKKIVAVYSSAFPRAVQTAEIAARELGLKPRVEKDLRERHMGVIELLTPAEAREKFPRDLEGIHKFGAAFVPKNGEAHDRVFERMKKVLLKISKKHGKEGDAVLVVSHGAAIRTFLSGLMHMPFSSLHLRHFNTAVTVLEVNKGVVTAKGIAYKTHLKQAESKTAKRGTTIICLARHGESEGNVKKIYQGQGGNWKLTLNGRKQAKQLAKRLKGEGIEVVYCSDLARALETAQIVARELGGLKVTVLKGLRERHYGKIQGMTFDEAHKKFRKFWLDRQKKGMTAIPPGGESHSSVSKRMSEAMKKVAESGKNALVVSHDPAIPFLLAKILKMPFKQAIHLRHKNTGFSILEFDGKELRVKVVNEHSHLK
jgi:broad specificity phosphatase PhoE